MPGPVTRRHPLEAGAKAEVPMGYAVTFGERATYLHAIVTGENSVENVAAYLEEIRHECLARSCSCVLIEERLTGPRLGTIDVFELASRASERALGVFRAIAYVDVNAGAPLEFAETVAVNRGVPVAVFSSVTEAERWLLDRGGEDAGVGRAL